MVQIIYLALPLLVLMGIALLIVSRAESRIRNRVIGIVLCFAVAVAWGWSGMHPAFGEEKGAKPAMSGDVKAGAELYEDTCKTCHPDGGNSMDPDLPVKGSKMLVNFDTFLQYLRGKKSLPGKTREMPTFASYEISDDQARDLYRYIIEDIEKK